MLRSLRVDGLLTASWCRAAHRGAPRLPFRRVADGLDGSALSAASFSGSVVARPDGRSLPRRQERTNVVNYTTRGGALRVAGRAIAALIISSAPSIASAQRIVTPSSGP